MKLSEVLKKFQNRDFDVIEYRTINSIDSKDVNVWGGMAQYKNKMLISLDGDTYHLSDEVVKYELYKDNWLVVYV